MCNTCLRIVPAEVILRNGRVFLQKVCPQHGRQTQIHPWGDPEVFEFIESLPDNHSGPAGVIIEVTQKCNLNCSFCYNNSGRESGEHFQIEDILKASGDSYHGVYLTGGEPTLHPKLVSIIKELSRRKKRVTILTNGIKMSDGTYTAQIVKAGLSTIVLQFDTFHESTSREIRGESLVKIKKRTIANAERNALPVILFTLLIRDKNLDDLKEFPKFLYTNSAIKMLNLSTIVELGRFDNLQQINPSILLDNVTTSFGLSRKDFYASSRFLWYASLVRKRVYWSKCCVTCLALPSSDGLIPLSQLVDLEYVNRKLEFLIASKHKQALFVPLLAQIIFSQFMIRSLTNKTTRLMWKQLAVNFRKFGLRRLSLLNPLVAITVASFQSVRNLDLSYTQNCSKTHYDYAKDSFPSACVHLIKLNHNREISVQNKT
jgi:organic radical activating enzyme